MPKYSVSGYYKVTKYVDRIVKADSENEAKSKAWAEDYVEQIEYDETTIGDFVSTEVEEVEE